MEAPNGNVTSIGGGGKGQPKDSRSEPRGKAARESEGDKMAREKRVLKKGQRRATQLKRVLKKVRALMAQSESLGTWELKGGK
jgi:hypothetical protein